MFLPHVKQEEQKTKKNFEKKGITCQKEMANITGITVIKQKTKTSENACQTFTCDIFCQPRV